MPENAAIVESGSPSAGRRVWRALVILAVVAFIGLLLYGLLSKGTSDRIDEALNKGQALAAPAFNLRVIQKGDLPRRLAGRLEAPLADGKLSTTELRGTPFVLNLWASWCEPCNQEAKPLQTTWRELGPRGVLMLGLDIQDVTGDALAFMSRHGATYPSVREPEREVANSYGATGIPETFFIDRQGRVVGHVIGAVNTAQLFAGANAAVTGRVAGVGEGGEKFKQPRS